MSSSALVFSLGLAALLGACSKASPAPAGAPAASAPPAASVAPSSPPGPVSPMIPPTRDACALVTKEEVKNATGLEVLKVEPSRTAAYDGCDLRGPKDRTVFVGVMRTRPDFEKRQREDEAALGAKAEPLAGVGDSAWTISGKQMGFPSVVVGVTSPYAVFVVAETGPAGADAKALRAGLVDLAKITATRF